MAATYYIPGGSTYSGSGISISFEDFRGFGSGVLDPTDHVILTEDIDLGGTNSAPIEFGGDGFQGTFDGAGYTISNFTYSTINNNGSGLFAFLASDSSVSNLTLSNFEITGSYDYVGALAGSSGGTSISNVHVIDSKINGNKNVSGLIGFAEPVNSGCEISECSVENTTVTGTENVGGFIGVARGSRQPLLISKSYVTGTIEGTENVGGFIGIMIGGVTLSECYFDGTLDCSGAAGGLVGSMEGGPGTSSLIENAYAIISDDSSLGASFGGIAGKLGQDSGVTNAYVPRDSFSGDIIGSITDSFYTGTTASGLNGVTLDDLKKIETFRDGTDDGLDLVSLSWNIIYLSELVSWLENSDDLSDFIWYIDEGNDYPKFVWDYSPAPINQGSDSGGKGHGHATIVDPNETNPDVPVIPEPPEPELPDPETPGPELPFPGPVPMPHPSFPWLWIILGILIIGIAGYLIFRMRKKQT